MKNTISRLLEKLNAHEQQIATIMAVLPGLEVLQQTGRLPTEATFEVHFQCYWPDQRSIRTIGTSISQAYVEAVALWKEYNAKSQRPHHGRAEVFICLGDLRVPVSWIDAVQIANNNEEGMMFSTQHFGGDDRVFGNASKAVWGVDEELPGWYAKNVTEHKPAEVVAA